MGPRCSSAETQVCHRSYIIAASVKQQLLNHSVLAAEIYSEKGRAISYDRSCEIEGV